MGSVSTDSIFRISFFSEFKSLSNLCNVNRVAAQRCRQREHATARSNESIAALNSLVGCSIGDSGDTAFGESCRSRTFSLHHKNIPPTDILSPKEAYESLLGGASSVYGESTTVRPYSRDLVSWPHEQVEPCPLHKLLPRSVSDEISGLHPSFVRSQDEYSHVVEDEGNQFFMATMRSTIIMFISSLFRFFIKKVWSNSVGIVS